MKYIFILLLFIINLSAQETEIYKTYHCYPIHKAIIDGDLSKVKAFISADKLLLRKLTKRKKETPLNLACQFGHLEIVKYLISQGVGPDEKGEGARITPLYSAVLSGKIEILDYLISQGADINLTTGKLRKDIGILAPGRTPLGFAAIQGNKKIVEYLLKKGADINKLYYGDMKETALDEAANEEIKAILIKHGGKSGKDLK